MENNHQGVRPGRVQNFFEGHVDDTERTWVRTAGGVLISLGFTAASATMTYYLLLDEANIPFDDYLFSGRVLIPNLLLFVPGVVFMRLYFNRWRYKSLMIFEAVMKAIMWLLATALFTLYYSEFGRAINGLLITAAHLALWLMVLVLSSYLLRTPPNQADVRQTQFGMGQEQDRLGQIPLGQGAHDIPLTDRLDPIALGSLQQFNYPLFWCPQHVHPIDIGLAELIPGESYTLDQLERMKFPEPGQSLLDLRIEWLNRRHRRMQRIRDARLESTSRDFSESNG